MHYNRAFGLSMEALDIVVIDDAKPMQIILRSILNALKVGRVRIFDNTHEALQSMLVEPPSLIITDWFMRPTNGLQLIRTMRSSRLQPLCFVPAILVTAHPTRKLVNTAIRYGAHFVVVKPLAPATLTARIEALTRDERQFTLDAPSNTYQIDGVNEVLAAQNERWRHFHSLRVVAAQLSSRSAPNVEVPPVEIDAVVPPLKPVVMPKVAARIAPPAAVKPAPKPPVTAAPPPPPPPPRREAGFARVRRLDQAPQAGQAAGHGS